MMNLYHFVPDDMHGTILYPLNQMRDKLPELFDKQAAKYAGREDVQDTVIPGLGTWNDVIHLSPIDPKKVIAALRECGAPADFTWKAFQIDVSTLDPAKLVIMTTLKDGDKYVKEFLPFTEENYQQNCELPEITKQHYRDSVAKGEQPLTYAGAPHVLYKGTIDTSNVKIIEA